MAESIFRMIARSSSRRRSLERFARARGTPVHFDMGKNRKELQELPG
jgi:hypothetical protein